MHMVHQAADGSFSVVSILYKYGDADPLLTKVFLFYFKIIKFQFYLN